MKKMQFQFNGLRCFFFLQILILACKPRIVTDDSALKEAIDGVNNPKVFGNLQSLTYDQITMPEFAQGALKEIPWSDTYWPLEKAGLAHRWIMDMPRLEIKFDKDGNPENLRAAMDEFLFKSPYAGLSLQWDVRSPAEKYDAITGETRQLYAGNRKNFAYTRRELSIYAGNVTQYSKANISWGWMGHCHGWAPASLAHKPPKHAVMAKTRDNDEILFTEGDLRGLLTKGFADNIVKPSEQMLGGRCQASTARSFVKSDNLLIDQDDEGAIVLDSIGRVVDGVIADIDGNGALANRRGIHIVLNNWLPADQREAGVGKSIIVYHELGSDQLKYLKARAYLDEAKGIVLVDVYPFLRDKGIPDQSVKPTQKAFRYLKSCRDVNPGALHIVLARLLSQASEKVTGKAEGFVMDGTRDNEVWNYPVYAYRTRIGDLTAITDQNRTQDPYHEFRAEGTAYLAHVITIVTYGIENGPLVQFKPQDNQSNSDVYEYTLEFDAQKNIIGGEWHRASTEDVAVQVFANEQLFERLRKTIQLPLENQVDADPDEDEFAIESSPDFLWRFPGQPRFTEKCVDIPCLDPKVVYRLYECSLTDQTTGVRQIKDPKNPSKILHNIPYSECKL